MAKKKKREQSMLLTGEFMATQRGFGFVRIEGEDSDVFISERDCLNAFHGDTVEIEVTEPALFEKKENENLGRKSANAGEKNGKNAGSTGSKQRQRKREGKVVRVIRRKYERIVGTFSRQNKITFVIPDDEKFTSDIYIPKGATLGASNGHKVVVELTSYGTGPDERGKRQSPEGQVIQILGHVNDPGVDILSIVKRYEIPEEFPGEVMCQTAAVSEEVLEREKEDRLDIRALDTVTIDGEDAKDLDDAITIEKREDGTFELGVHIADVSHYVTENSPLDREALLRGTSVYLVDRVIPMLPHRLSNGICSLNAGEDRLALSCFMTFDEKGQLIGHKIEETLIRVTERMSYTDVNDILTNHKKETCERYETLIPMFETMQELAMILRKNRKKQGSIDFNFTECKIHLDDKGHPVDILPYERNVATKIIEEFMLAANQTVAEEYYWLEMPFLYRTHENPDLEKVQELARMTAGFGYHIKVGNQQVHPREIQKLIEQLDGTEEEDFLCRLILRSMKRAKYSTVNDGHFGLATRYYCHFTSPIRRYPDLQIHRIIKENLHRRMSGERQAHYEELLPEVAVKTSECERRADDAEREVEKVKKAEYMLDHIGEVFTGVINGVTSWGIYVELPNTVEGMVRISDIPYDTYSFVEEKYCVVGHYTGRIFQMGQQVEVQAVNADKMTGTIDFEFYYEELAEEY